MKPKSSFACIGVLKIHRSDYVNFLLLLYYFPRLNCLRGSVDLQRDLAGSDTFLNSYGSGKMDRKLRQLCDFSSDSAGN